jgi:hypothetical protein
MSTPPGSALFLSLQKEKALAAQKEKALAGV